MISVVLTASVNARTGIDCTKVMDMRPDLAKACYDQTNDWLNDNFQLLLNKRKESLSQLNLLKNTQHSWLQSREAQCKLTAGESAGNVAIARIKCAVLMTSTRAQELEKVLFGIDQH